MKDLIVLDLLRLVKDKAAQVEIDCTEDDFQCVVDVNDAFWTYRKCEVKEIKQPFHSSPLMRIVI